MKEKSTCAPLKLGVIMIALAAILLLAAAVCVLHGVNAVSLRGGAALDGYNQLTACEEMLLGYESEQQARTYAVFADGEKRFALHMADPWVERGIMHIEGTLLRIDQPVSEIRMRVGLLAEGAKQAELLNTQMVRRHAVKAHGYDDHSGFSAAVKRDDLAQGVYRVVLVDETDGAKRMIHTGMTVKLIEGGLAFAREDVPESEEQHAQ